MHNERLTIGRLARLCRLSVEQLRHYDETGLLAPVRVDANSGYRYYAPEQARDALTGALLREMDLPLAVIAQALAAELPAAPCSATPTATSSPNAPNSSTATTCAPATGCTP